MNQSPIFDEETHDILRAELGAESTTEVVTVFLADTSRKTNAIGQNDASRSVVKREAHSIKSSAATLGFERLSQVARELESQAETMEASSLSQLISKLQAAFGEAAAFAAGRLLSAAGEMPR